MINEKKKEELRKLSREGKKRRFQQGTPMKLGGVK